MKWRGRSVKHAIIFFNQSATLGPTASFWRSHLSQLFSLKARTCIMNNFSFTCSKQGSKSAQHLKQCCQEIDHSHPLCHSKHNQEHSAYGTTHTDWNRHQMDVVSMSNLHFGRDTGIVCKVSPKMIPHMQHRSIVNKPE